jgi:tetratricopeptide (TPR) repeat protein
MEQEEIERLLQDGLALYGFGKTQEAVAIWKKVLELDPGNKQAIDYIESAGFTVDSSTVVTQSIQPRELEAQDTEFININYIRELLKSRRYELAYEFLNKLYEKSYSSNKLIIAYLSIVKAQLIKLYYEELYSFKGVPKLNIGEQELVRYNLDKNDGYLISMIDGYSTLEEIFQMINTMERFEVIKRFHKLAKLGVIGF